MDWEILSLLGNQRKTESTKNRNICIVNHINGPSQIYVYIIIELNQFHSNFYSMDLSERLDWETSVTLA